MLDNGNANAAADDNAAVVIVDDNFDKTLMIAIAINLIIKTTTKLITLKMTFFFIHKLT